MTNQVFQGTVTSVNPITSNNGTPKWSITVEGLADSVFSLKGATVGDTIFYEMRTATSGRLYPMHLEKNGDSYDVARTEELKASNSKSGNNSWGRKMQAPLSPVDAVGILAQVAKEIAESGLAKYLVNELAYTPELLSSTITSIYISATRERADYEAPSYPRAAEVLAYTPSEEGEEDNVSETDDLLEEL